MKLQLGVALTIAALCEAFCPLKEHQICNPETKHACVCALLQADEDSAPTRSCNRVAKLDENEEFPAVSITFDLAKEHDDDESWPQKEVLDGIASTLRIPKETVIILRANCVYDDEDKDGDEEEHEERLVVQFAVLKKNANGTLPYGDNDFVDAENLASRMKVMLQSSGNGKKLGGLEVEKIEFVDQLIEIELNPSNWELIVQAILMALLFGFMLVLGCFCLCRKNGEEYDDELQKRPV